MRSAIKSSDVFLSKIPCTMTTGLYPDGGSSVLTFTTKYNTHKTNAAHRTTIVL